MKKTDFLEVVMAILVILLSSLLLMCLALGPVPPGRFMPTPEMLKSKVKSWQTVVTEKDVYLNEAIVKYCKNYQKFDFVSIRDLVLIRNPWIKQGTDYNIRKGDSPEMPQF